MRSQNPAADYRTVTPRMFVDDPEAAVAFLREVFDAKAEIQPGRPTDVHIGDSVILIGSSLERGPFPTFLYIYVDAPDTIYEKALHAGAKSLEAPLDTPYGDRRAMFSDPFGNVYQVAHRE